MRNSVILAMVLAIFSCTTASHAVTAQQARAFAGQDLHMNGLELATFSAQSGKHTLLYKGQFSLSAAGNSYSSDNAVIWIESASSALTQASSMYRVRVFLDGNVKVAKGKRGKTLDARDSLIDCGDSLMSGFVVRGEVFATAENRSEADFTSDELYVKAASYLKPIRVAQASRVQPGAIVPSLQKGNSGEIEDGNTEEDEPFFAWAVPPKLTNEPTSQPLQQPQVQEEVQYKYPVNIAGIWEPSPKIEKTTLPDGTSVATVVGRFYLWHRLDDEGGLIEFQADNAVIFFTDDEAVASEEKVGATDELLSSADIKAVYVQGNIVMAEGERTIRADEILYNVADNQALVINAEMRTFDDARGVPVYLRADKLMRVSECIFHANDVTITSDEFYMPQVSATASSVVVIDSSNLENRAAKLDKKVESCVIMEDMRLKLGKCTIFRWPKLVSKLGERPDLPIKRVRIGSRKSFGTSLETDWYLNRLMGWRETLGVDSTLAVDYYSKRGPGAGFDIDYKTEDSYGEMVGYIVRDSGEDRLGRSSGRKDLDPENDLRGRATFRHREYLPYGWQMTLEAGYLSDAHFYESFYRDEFTTSKATETLAHFKRLKNNWAFSWLVKGRINDFQEQLEELPSAQFHMVGQDVFGGLMTYYTHNMAGHLKQRYADGAAPSGSQHSFTFASSRHELDMPLMWGKSKIVPYVAGTFGLDDGDGFAAGLNGESVDNQSKVWLGEIGVRASTQFWKINPTVKSRLWDVNGIRHTVRPHFEATFYEESDDAIEMRDTFNIGLAQRWQTKRGSSDGLRTVDWMRFNVDATWVNDSASADNSGPGPDKYIFNDSSIPLFDRRTTDGYGIRRNSINTDYFWLISDTYALMSDLNYDMQSGEVTQFNFGVTRYCWPNMSWYVGNRYLKRVVSSSVADGFHEQGSNALNVGVSYKVSPRYTVVFNQEYNFDYGKNVRSEVALIRRYHRIFYGIAISTDQSLDSSSIVFSIWPEGVKDLSFGSRKYYGLSRANYYE